MKMKLLMESWRSFTNENRESLQEMDKGAVHALNNPGTPLATYVAVLKKYADDPEFDKIAAAGQQDGAPTDEVAKVTPATVAAQELTATQAEIGFGNSLADQVQNKFDSTKTALGLNGTPIVMSSKAGPVPLLVYNGKYILDGHHRWSQIMMVNPTGTVKIDNLTGPAIDNEEEALKVMQFAIAANADKVVTKPFEGENLMQANPKQVENYVLKNVTDEVLQLLVQAEKIAKPDKRLAAKYIAGNLPVIKKSAGRFSREKSMPQAGDSGVSQDTVNKSLETGKVNFDRPMPSDVRQSD
jgi:CheY-like chemotaxis protein